METVGFDSLYRVVPGTPQGGSFEKGTWFIGIHGELEKNELKWNEWLDMNDLKWRNRNEWIETNELKWKTWNEWLDMNELTWRNWYEGIEIKKLKWIVMKDYDEWIHKK